MITTAPPRRCILLKNCGNRTFFPAALGNSSRHLTANQGELCQHGEPATLTFITTMNQRKNDISDQVVAESLRIARANQVPGQTKEQTQLIALGIQKGIAEYKRQQKAKQREADRLRKKQRQQMTSGDEATTEASDNDVETGYDTPGRRMSWLPWSLLLLSWAAMGGWFLFGR